MPRTLHTLPTQIEPVKVLVLPVFVPDDPAYVAAVSGQLGNLGYWHNWQRDNEHRATLVAQYWQELYNQTLELWRLIDYDLNPITINCNQGGFPYATDD